MLGHNWVMLTRTLFPFDNLFEKKKPMDPQIILWHLMILPVHNIELVIALLLGFHPLRKEKVTPTQKHIY